LDAEDFQVQSGISLPIQAKPLPVDQRHRAG